MRTRILATSVVLIVLAGCEPPTVNPISEEMFISEPQTAPQMTAALPTPQTTTVTALGPDGRPLDPALAMVEEDPYDSVVVSETSGLTERLPDTCKLADFQYLQGATTAEVNAAGLSRPFRVVGPTDIVTQEYNPMRVNFYTNDAGKVTRISCG